MNSQILNVDGVPEHFNLPWRLLAESSALEKLGISLRWTDVREGTGRMIERLSSGDADIALLLTEGAIAGITRGGAYRILGAYVASPLQWGVHVGAQSDFQTAGDLVRRRFAISRYGSGSHLMAAVYAQTGQWQDTELEFVVVNDIDGARRALADDEADIFLWERFTTKPYVDNGEFRRVDVIPTPWPAFVACISESALAKNQAAAELACHAARFLAARVQSLPDAAQRFADRYSLKVVDVSAWLSETRWSTDGAVDQDILTQTSDALYSVGMIDKKPDISDLLVQA